MTHEDQVRAEAILSLSAEAFAALMVGEARATARIAGILAAKRMPELIPLRPATPAPMVTIAFEALGNRIRVVVTATSTDAAEARIQALTAASVAALTLYDMAADETASIDGLTACSTGKRNDTPRRPAVPREIVVRSRPSEPQGRVRPQVLMGEVAAPRAAPDTRREAFRNFMTSNRLRPTTWAKDAGVATGEIMGFLTGRSRGFSSDVAEKLARAARVRVEDMFR